MPIHVLIAHLVVVLAPMAAVVAGVYAIAPSTRGLLRWPFVVLAGGTAALAAWAGEAGGDLLDQVTATGSPTEVAAATDHAKGSGALTLTVFALAAMAVVAGWWLLRPGRSPSPVTRVGSVVLAVTAAVVVSATVSTVMSALDAVWTHGTAAGR